MKKIIAALLGMLLPAVLLLSGCSRQAAPVYTKYQAQFFGAFDTVIQLVGYTETRDEFDLYADYAETRFVELSHLFDRFYRYDGVNNIKSVNDNAGRAPVRVDPLIIELIELCQEWYTETDGQTDPAMGAVLEVWHSYMNTYSGSTNGAKIPTAQELEAAVNASMDDVVVDKEKSTVYLAKEGMLLDLGAAAKGYAAQLVADELYQNGLTSFIISAGGNVVAKDAPLDGVRNSWGIGIQDPFADVNDPNSTSIDVVFVTNESVVTSGDYQRYYMVDDKRMHHIIDPDTLMPADFYRGITVVHPDSGVADILSTALFCMDYETSRTFADEHNLKVMWILPDGQVEYTDELNLQLRDRGGATSTIKKN